MYSLSDDELPDLLPTRGGSSNVEARKSQIPDDDIEEITIIDPKDATPILEVAKTQKNKHKKQQTTCGAPSTKPLKPVELLKSLHMKIERSLLEISEGRDIINYSQTAGIVYELVDQEPKYSIRFWLDSEGNYIDDAIVVIPVTDFTELISGTIYSNSLVNCCRKWKQLMDATKLTVIVIGFEAQLRGAKNDTKRAYKKRVMGEMQQEQSKPTAHSMRIAAEESLVACHIEENVNHRMFESPSNFAEFLCQAVKSLSERASKLSKEFNDLGFYAEGSASGTVKVDKSGVGLQRLWLQQLRQFTNVGVETAQAIARVYPSVQSLMKAYASNTTEDGPYLLSEIPVRRGQGPLASTRKIGPELSTKIHQFFTSKDPMLILGHK